MSISDTIVNLAISPMSAVTGATYGGACLAAGMSGLYQSDDAGQTWQSVDLTSAGVTPEAASVLAVCTAAQVVLAGLAGGVARSADGGQTWAPRPFPLPAPTVTALGMSPDFEQDGTAYAGSAEDGVFRSEDGGLTWTSWNFGLFDRHILSLAVSPAHPVDGLLLAGTSSGIFRSINGGRSWRAVKWPVPGTPVLCLALSPDFAQDGLAFAGTESKGMYVSDDRGQTWSRVTMKGIPAAWTKTVNAMLLTPSHASATPSRAMGPQVLAALGGGLAISRDGGRTWAEWAAVPGVLCLAAPLNRGPELRVLAGQMEEGVRWLRKGSIA